MNVLKKILKFLIVMGPMWWIISVMSIIGFIFSNMTFFEFFFGSIGSIIITTILAILDTLSIYCWVTMRDQR